MAKRVLGVFAVAAVLVACSSDDKDNESVNAAGMGAGVGTAGAGSAGAGTAGAGTAGAGEAGTGAGATAAGASAAGSGAAGTGEAGTGAGAAAAGTGAAGTGSTTTVDVTTPFADLPDECVGFEVLGLEHSPGGEVLPNTCAEFDRVRNNPYAIRCIDADPSYDTGWPGDEWCILPPDPDLGIQVGVNPDDYDNPESGFVLEPGQEITNNYYTNADNPEPHYYYRVNLRMRTGSHHIINSRIPDRSDGWTNEADTGLGQPGFPGAQRPDTDRPLSFEIPPEDQGLGERFEANQQIQFNMHHFNFSQGPMLREVWVNVWWKPDDEVEAEPQGIGIFGSPADLNIPAGEHRVLEYKCDVTGATRILELNGHRHAHTERFGVWIVREDGSEETVYESFDYTNMPTYPYDSITQNPVPDLETRTDGAKSGFLEVFPGDAIHFVCDVNNTSSNMLRFANEVQTGEMCILFGARVGAPLCSGATRVP
jgi:hypothetical protein